MSAIIVKRGSSYTDRFRQYKIFLDGKVIGKVKAGTIFEAQVSEGLHKLVIKIDWGRSNYQEFSVGPRESAYFECGSNLIGWKGFLAIFYITFMPHKYLWLRQSSK